MLECREMRRSIAAALMSVLALANGSAAATLPQARSNAIVWLERNQNPDGSWGSGSTTQLVTAEALNALAKAGRGGGAAAQRALAWVRAQEYVSLDYRARAIRAAAQAGANMGTAANQLVTLGSGKTGWGTVVGGATNSYDSAVVSGAIFAAGVNPGDRAAKKDQIIARRRPDGGWSGDFVPGSEGASDVTTTAEIVRALSGFAVADLEPSITYIANTSGGLASVDTLEIASRLAALNAVGDTSPGRTALEAELAARAPTSGTWTQQPSGTVDPYVAALGLLAITTKPGATWGGGPTADDDGDGHQNQSDVFPQDPLEWADLDRDGIGDSADLDRDGDGRANAQDSLPDDPNEYANFDGDAQGDSADLDDDNDGVSDLDEAARRTDPRDADTDDDGVLDGSDTACPLIAGGTDADGDTVCTPADRCPNDPSEYLDSDNDPLCNGFDPDDDGDTWTDVAELDAGSDPLNALSVPTLPETDYLADYDGDGLNNLAEILYSHTSGNRADTDGDGATDWAEWLGTLPTNPNSVSSQPAPLLVVFSAMSQAPNHLVAPSLALYEQGGIQGAVTGGQVTPISSVGGSGLPSQAAGVLNLAGFQPMTRYGRDLDGDGLKGVQENAKRSSGLLVDTDGDRFADGSDGVVSVARVPQAWDLDGDGFVDGEGDVGTDAASAEDRPGKPGDVAPFGAPDGKLTAGDAALEMRLVANPSLFTTLSGQRRQICEQAAHTNGDGSLDVKDVVFTLRQSAATAP